MTTPKPPAEGLPGLLDLWLTQRALERRIALLERNAHPMPWIAPNVARAFAPLAFMLLFSIGVAAALVAFAVALPWALS